MSLNPPHVLANIRAGIAGPEGFALIGVGSPPVSFTYSIGLTDRIGVEFIMLAVNPHWASMGINTFAATLVEDKLPELQTPIDIGYTFPMVLMRCAPKRVREYVVQADAYYERPVEVVQMVVPDRQGVFPWQDGYEAEYMDPRQPRLWEPA